MTRQGDQENGGFPSRLGALIPTVLSGCAALAGIASVSLLVAGDRDIAYLGGMATVLLVLAYELISWLRSRKIVLPAIPVALAQELRAQLQAGDRKTVLVRLRDEYPQLPFGKRIELMRTL